MQRYTIIHPLYLSFFSKDLYLDVARNWKGLCLLYLLSVLALCLIPGVMRTNVVLTDFIDKEAPEIIQQIPEITIVKGNVSINGPEPYLINDKKSEKTLMIIDTTGKIASLKNSQANLLLTKTELIVKRDDTAMRTFDLSSIEKYHVDRSQVYNFLESFKTWFAFILYPVALFFSFLYHLLQIFVYAAIGILFARACNTVLRYSTLVRLAAIAITPVLVLDALLVFAGIEIPYWWYTGNLIAAGYLFFAVRVNAQDKGDVPV